MSSSCNRTHTERETHTDAKDPLILFNLRASQDEVMAEYKFAVTQKKSVLIVRGAQVSQRVDLLENSRETGIDPERADNDDRDELGARDVVTEFHNRPPRFGSPG